MDNKQDRFRTVERWRKQLLEQLKFTQAIREKQQHSEEHKQIKEILE